MYYNHLKNEIHNLISGQSEVSFGRTIQAIASYLSGGEETGAETQNSKQIRIQETKKLEKFISDNKLWIENIDYSQYISEGAEQRVFLKNSENVVKLNDAIYYSSWKDYFYSLLLHNYFFADTAYELLGFIKEDNNLYAVVQQAFVLITEETDLNQVKSFLFTNGFVNTRSNDYYNPDLGIILEDLHDENVLTKNNILYFIDTVFYLTKDFWNIEKMTNDLEK